jgi:hypothetical protein
VRRREPLSLHLRRWGCPYCLQQCGYPAIPLEKYTREDIDREYTGKKPCVPFCTVSCVHRVAMLDLIAMSRGRRCSASFRQRGLEVRCRFRLACASWLRSFCHRQAESRRTQPADSWPAQCCGSCVSSSRETEWTGELISICGWRGRPPTQSQHQAARRAHSGTGRSRRPERSGPLPPERSRRVKVSSEGKSARWQKLMPHARWGTRWHGCFRA